MLTENNVDTMLRESQATSMLMEQTPNREQQVVVMAKEKLLATFIFHHRWMHLRLGD